MFCTTNSVILINKTEKEYWIRITGGLNANPNQIFIQLFRNQEAKLYLNETQTDIIIGRSEPEVRLGKDIQVNIPENLLKAMIKVPNAQIIIIPTDDPKKPKVEIPDLKTLESIAETKIEPAEFPAELIKLKKAEIALEKIESAIKELRK